MSKSLKKNPKSKFQLNIWGTPKAAKIIFNRKIRRIDNAVLAKIVNYDQAIDFTETVPDGGKFKAVGCSYDINDIAKRMRGVQPHPRGFVSMEERNEYLKQYVRK